MGFLKVLYSNNTVNLFKYTLKNLKGYISDISKENIIIVPDRLSLATEQELFDALGIDVYYNISVMGITKFAHKIVADNNLNFLQCSALECKLLTLKAIQNVSKDFKCFSKKYTLGFVDEVYAKIEQIKSSNVNIEDLFDENAGEGSKLKFEDIKLIYNEYEKLRDGRLDGCALLNLVNQVCQQSDYLKNCNVFFVGFDALTRQGIEILKNVAKTANYTQISVVYAKSQNNYRLYDQTFFDTVISACKSEQIECEVKWCDLPFENNEKNMALQNLFSRSNQVDFDADYFHITKTNSVAEEIELCIKKINYLLKTTNTSFNDIAICVDNSYARVLASELENLGISVYCDQKTMLSTLEPIKYILALLKFLNTKNTKHLREVLTNEFCDLAHKDVETYLTDLTKYGTIKNINSFSKNENLCAKNFVEHLLEQEVLKKDIADNYLNKIQILLKEYQIIEKIDQKCDFFDKKHEILLNKTYLQLEKKLQACFDAIFKTVGTTLLTIDEFVQILEKSFDEIQISSVPSCVNQVFVGDVNCFYINKKYIFVLGMNEGLMPGVLADTGLITDSEILSDTIKAKIEPTTKIINKRSKFKVFEILLSATKQCYLSYHTFDSENKSSQPNEFVSEIVYLMKTKISTGQVEKVLFNSADDKKLCFNMIDEYHANLALKDDYSDSIKAIIKMALAKNNALFTAIKINHACMDFSKLFFRNKRASVSLVEKYNGCPKSAYLANGLKLQKIEKDKIEANLIGNFLHEVGELFVRKNLKKLGQLTEIQIQENVENITEKMLKDEQYYSLCLPANKFTLKLLKAEALRFCIFINYEQTLSKFKPLYAEKYFGQNSDFKSIKVVVDGEEYDISGFVDRIDVCDDYFRIIDYKTGNTTNSKGAEHLFYGTKIQLFVYAKAIKENLTKNLFGVFYLPIKNGFNKDGEAQYAFSGFFENNAELATKCDLSMSEENLKSQLLNVSLTKTKEDNKPKLRKKANLLSKEELQSYLDYSLKIMEQTIKDIKQGYVDCSPIKDRCKICEFNQICKYAFDEKYQRQEDYDVSSENFVKLMEQDLDGK